MERKGRVRQQEGFTGKNGYREDDLEYVRTWMDGRLRRNEG